MASTLSSKISAALFWFLLLFVVVFIILGLIVMSYWLHIDHKHPSLPIQAYGCVFFYLRWKLLILMAVKILKINFRIWTNPKTIFLNCKTVSVMTRPLIFLLQPKLIWLVVLSSIYWCCDFDATSFSNFFKIFLIFFVIFVHFEILSLDPIIESSQSLSECVLSVIKVIKVLEKSLRSKFLL